MVGEWGPKSFETLSSSLRNRTVMSLETSHPNVAVSQVPTNHLGSENFVASTIPNSCADGETLIVFFLSHSFLYFRETPVQGNPVVDIASFRSENGDGVSHRHLRSCAWCGSYDETAKPNAWFEVLTSLSLVFKENTLNHGSHGFLPENDWESLVLPRV